MKYIHLLIVAFAFGCNMERNKEQNQNEGDHVSYSEYEMVEGEAWNDEQINDFMKEAAMIDKMQIRVGKMAQEKASNESIKIYGKLLVDEHTYSLNNLRKIARLQQVNISDSLDTEHQRKVNELEPLNGAAFERRFLEMMVDGHRKDIEKYREAQKNIPQDHEMKKWIDEVLPSLHRHHQKGQQLQQEQNNDDT